jgi:phasin
MKGTTMSASPFDVPSELRDFAERSVEQARKAFEGFLAVALRTAEFPSGGPFSNEGRAKSIAAQVIAYTDQNVNAAFDLASGLVRAKDAQEAFALQSEYLKAQLTALQTQAKELGAVLQKSVTPGTK